MSEDLEPRRKLKFGKLQNIEFDLLSKLPDSILVQILSKLETKDAVATSLLSSRYKSLWMNLNSLKFNNWFCRNEENIDKERQMFAHFVNRVFIFLKSKSIHKFCLRIDGLFPLYNVTTWLTAGIIRNLKVLKFDVSDEDDIIDLDCIVMPSCFYTCKTLEAIQIYNRMHLNVPEFVCFPNLTMIDLDRVKFSSDESVRRLISGCSALQYFSIVRNEYDNVDTFTIDSPTLKNINYSFHGDKGLIEKDFKFELNAPKLEYLHLFDDGSRDFVVHSLCPLENADIRVFSLKELNDPEAHYKRVVKLLQGFHFVNHLWIAGDTLEALSHVPAPPRIYSRYLRCSVLIMGRNNFGWSLQDVLEGSDKSLNIYLSKDSSDSTHVVNWKEPEELPLCLLSCLQTIAVCGFKSRESELYMIAYILKNAKVLKKMTISEATSEAEANYELLDKISKFDKGSGKCEITFLASGAT